LGFGPTAIRDDLFRRRFAAEGPDGVWFTDITQHRAANGWVYRCAVIDLLSRKVVGWSIADHVRSELVVDAPEMARWQHRSQGTVLHADRDAQYTSWVFRYRLPPAGLLACMGRVASSVDNVHIESPSFTVQRELLDRQQWGSRVELALAVFEWIEGLYNPYRRQNRSGNACPARLRKPAHRCQHRLKIDPLATGGF
jgi:transposase InsO family protein